MKTRSIFLSLASLAMLQIVAPSISNACETFFGGKPGSIEAAAAKSEKETLQDKEQGRIAGLSKTTNTDDTKTTLNLSDYTGVPFFETMLKIRIQMDNDAKQSFKLATWDQILARKANFHPDAYRKILKLFLSQTEARSLDRDTDFARPATQATVAKAEAALKKLVDALDASDVTTVDLSQTKEVAVAPHILKVVLAQVRKLGLIDPRGQMIGSMNLSTFLSLASEAGSKVILNDQNYFVNVGYQLDGVARNEKTGRSSTQSPKFGFNDASDTYLLRELDQLLGQKGTNPQYFRAMFELLNKSDASAYSKLSVDEQASLTDFIAVYSAEFRRSWMSNLKSHRWMDDLAEVELISAYGSEAQMVMNKDGFVPGQATNYFAVGADGSGIGVMRGYRRYLQQLVTNSVRELKPELVKNIEAIIGDTSKFKGDVIQGYLIFINDPANQAKVKANVDALTDAMTAFIDFTAENHADITKYVQTHFDKKVTDRIFARRQAMNAAKAKRDAQKGKGGQSNRRPRRAS